jgi:tetratricopeptide (TPR) repeat protein
MLSANRSQLNLSFYQKMSLQSLNFSHKKYNAAYLDKTSKNLSAAIAGFEKSLTAKKGGGDQVIQWQLAIAYCLRAKIRSMRPESVDQGIDDYNKAFQLYSSVLAKVGKEQSSEVEKQIADLYQGWAIAECKRGQYKVAIDSFERALGVYKKLFRLAPDIKAKLALGRELAKTFRARELLKTRKSGKTVARTSYFDAALSVYKELLTKLVTSAEKAEIEKQITEVEKERNYVKNPGAENSTSVIDDISKFPGEVISMGIILASPKPGIEVKKLSHTAQPSIPTSPEVAMPLHVLATAVESLTKKRKAEGGQLNPEGGSKDSYNVAYEVPRQSARLTKNESHYNFANSNFLVQIC